MTTSEYDDYVITADEKEPGKWQATVRRRDGRQIPMGDGTTLPEIKTLRANTSGEAIRLAWEAIDSLRRSSSSGWT